MESRSFLDWRGLLEVIQAAAPRVPFSSRIFRIQKTFAAVSIPASGRALQSLCLQLDVSTRQSLFCSFFLFCVLMAPICVLMVMTVILAQKLWPSALIALLGSVKLPPYWLNRGQWCWPQTSCTIVYHLWSLFIFFMALFCIRLCWSLLPMQSPLPLAFIAFKIRTPKADLGGGAGCHVSEPSICDFDL